MIIYKYDISGVTEADLDPFFEGWPEKPTLSKRLEILKNSDYVIIALDDENIAGFINAVTILINRDLRGGARDPSNRRRKAMQAIRQHLFVRTELQTGKTQTVENAGRGIRITDHQLAA